MNTLTIHLSKPRQKMHFNAKIEIKMQFFLEVMSNFKTQSCQTFTCTSNENFKTVHYADKLQRLCIALLDTEFM